jgi:hypothetical protein
MHVFSTIQLIAESKRKQTTKNETDFLSHHVEQDPMTS